MSRHNAMTKAQIDAELAKAWNGYKAADDTVFNWSIGVMRAEFVELEETLCGALDHGINLQDLTVVWPFGGGAPFIGLKEDYQ